MDCNSSDRRNARLLWNCPQFNLLILRQIRNTCSIWWVIVYRRLCARKWELMLRTKTFNLEKAELNKTPCVLLNWTYYASPPFSLTFYSQVFSAKTHSHAIEYFPSNDLPLEFSLFHRAIHFTHNTQMTIHCNETIQSDTLLVPFKAKCMPSMFTHSTKAVKCVPIFSMLLSFSLAPSFH